MWAGLLAQRSAEHPRKEWWLVRSILRAVVAGAICMCVCVRVCARVRVRTYMCVGVCVHVCVHTYIHTYTHEPVLLVARGALLERAFHGFKAVISVPAS